MEQLYEIFGIKLRCVSTKFKCFFTSIRIDATIELIKLQFSPKQAPYVITKPLYGSQKNKPIDENGVLITIEVIPNFELKSMILSFGKEVHVISPASLRNEIINLSYSIVR